MKKILLCMLLSGILGCKSQNAAPSLRIGWATAFAGLGQILATAERDPALREAQFLRFPTGPEMNEAALRDILDVIPIGIVPAAILLSRSDSWRIIARIYRFKQTTLALKSRGISNGYELRGKRIATGFGTGAHPYILNRFSQWGLIPGDSVRLLNIAPSEQVQALLNGTVDAVSSFEPVPAILKAKAEVTEIDSEEQLALLLVRADVLLARSQAVRSLLKSLKEATRMVALDRRSANVRYAEVAKIPPELLNNMDEIEENLHAKDLQEISFSLSAADLQRCQHVVDLLHQHGLITTKLTLTERLSPSGTP